MKYNTFDNYHMTATYQPFELETREADGLDYRVYTKGSDIKCKIIVNNLGVPTIFTKEALQPFALVINLRDVAGKPFMVDQAFTVRRPEPVFDPGGYIYAYAHSLNLPLASVFTDPVNPPPQWDYVDQQG